jgi:hypothetical protein
MASQRDRSARARAFRAEMKAYWQSINAPCGIDGQHHIDWDAPPFTPNAFEIEHIKPVSLHPELEFDPNNVRPSAHSCNRHRGTSNERPPVGATSEAW